MTLRSFSSPVTIRRKSCRAIESASFSPANIANLFGAWDFTDVTKYNFSSGVNVNTVSGAYGTTRTLTRESGATPPTYSAGEGCVMSDGAANGLRNISTVGDWNFLHNLSGGSTIFLVAKSTKSKTRACVMATQSATGGDIANGFRLDYTSNQAMYSVIGTGAARCVRIESPASSFPINETHLYTGSKDPHPAGFTNSSDFFTWADGLNPINSPVENNYSNATNTGDLYLGREAGGSIVDRFDGVLKELLVYNRVLTNAEQARVEAYLCVKYGVPYTPRTIGYFCTVHGQSNATGQDLKTNSIVYGGTIGPIGPNIFDPSANQAFNGLDLGNNHYTGQFDAPTLIGPIVSFAERAQNILGTQVYSLIYGVTGADISSFLTGGANKAALTSAVKTAARRFKEMGFGQVKTYVLWYQGETDAQNSTLAAGYGPKLAQLRSDYVGYLAPYCQVEKWISVKVQRATPYTYQALVNEFLNVGSDYFLDLSVNYIPGDDPHLTADSCYDIGYYAAQNNILPPE